MWSCSRNFGSWNCLLKSSSGQGNMVPPRNLWAEQRVRCGQGADLTLYVSRAGGTKIITSSMPLPGHWKPLLVNEIFREVPRILPVYSSGWGKLTNDEPFYGGLLSGYVYSGLLPQGSLVSSVWTETVTTVRGFVVRCYTHYGHVLCGTVGCSAGERQSGR